MNTTKKDLMTMANELKEGQTLKSGSGTYYIRKLNGTFKHVDASGDVLTGRGVNGFVIAWDNMNMLDWELQADFIEIDLNEVAERLKKGLTVYADDKKVLIDKFSDLAEVNGRDFEDVLLLTKYFKKR